MTRGEACNHLRQAVIRTIRDNPTPINREALDRGLVFYNLNMVIPISHTECFETMGVATRILNDTMWHAFCRAMSDYHDLFPVTDENPGAEWMAGTQPNTFRLCMSAEWGLRSFLEHYRQAGHSLGTDGASPTRQVVKSRGMRLIGRRKRDIEL